MMKNVLPGQNRLEPVVTHIATALVAAVLAASAARAQTPVVPAGTGTQGDPYRISQLGHLVWMGDSVGSSSGKYYTVQNHIDASATAAWNDGSGLAPIGNASVRFLGIFNGNGKVISGLAINRPSQSNVGLFGYVGTNGVVKDLRLAGGSVTGGDSVGSLVGNNYRGTVSGCYATASVTGIGNGCGSLMGRNDGMLSACYAAGPATGYWYVGGLVGYNGGTVNGCYAAGSVTGDSLIGGLVGWNSRGTVSGCYARGSVTGDTIVGGLVAQNYQGTVSSSYWDTQTSGQATSAGGTGRTTAQMKQQATFAGWDFASVWGISENMTYPFLRWQGAYAGAMDAGNGWNYSAWFGYFMDGGGTWGGWIWHAEHGWLYGVGASPASIWFWSSRLDWLWSSDSAYPFFWHNTDGVWLYYYRNSGNGSGGWFYNYGTGQNEWR